MVCVSNSIFTQLRGKMAGMVFFTRRGRMYARKAASEVVNPQTPLQQLQRNRMSDVVAFYGIIRNTFLAAGWHEAARGKPYTGMNLFIRRNIGGFDGNGHVTDYARLHFATGPLPVCDCLKAVCDPPKRKIRLDWQNRTLLNSARMSDRLVAVVVDDEEEFTIFPPEQLQCSRSACTALITLPEAGSDLRWVYVFFTDKAGEVFSDDIACPLND